MTAVHGGFAFLRKFGESRTAIENGVLTGCESRVNAGISYSQQGRAERREALPEPMPPFHRAQTGQSRQLAKPTFGYAFNPKRVSRECEDGRRWLAG